MSKKKKKADKVFNELDEHLMNLRTAFEGFYDDYGSLNNFNYSSEENPFDEIMKKENPPSQSQEEMMEECLKIKTYVSQAKLKNIEIRLDKHDQKYGGQTTAYGMTIIRARSFDNDMQSCIYYKDDDSLQARVYIGGDNYRGYLVTKGEDGEFHFTKLREFHLLSTTQNPDPRKDFGLITSYTWLTGIYTSMFMSYSLMPIKNLILSDWLQSEWQRAKDAREKSLDDKVGDNKNG